MDKKLVYKIAGVLLLILSAFALLNQYYSPLAFDSFISIIFVVGSYLVFPFYILPIVPLYPTFIFLLYILIGGYFAWLGWKKKPENKTLYYSAWLHVVLSAFFISVGVGIEIFCRISGLSDCSQAMFAFVLPLALLQAIGFVVLVIGLVKQYVLK